MRPSLTFWIVLTGCIVLAGTFVIGFQITRLGGSHDAPVLATKTGLSALRTALNAFDVHNGHFPTGKSGLLDLFRQPVGETNWHGPYLDSDRVLKDPWGNEYTYECPGTHNTNSFDLISCGPDGRLGTDDDICNWQK